MGAVCIINTNTKECKGGHPFMKVVYAGTSMKGVDVTLLVGFYFRMSSRKFEQNTGKSEKLFTRIPFLDLFNFIVHSVNQ